MNVGSSGVARLTGEASMQTRRDLSGLGTVNRLLMTGVGWRHGSMISFSSHSSVVFSMAERSASGNFFFYLGPTKAGSEEIDLMLNSGNSDGNLISDN